MGSEYSLPTSAANSAGALVAKPPLPTCPESNDSTVTSKNKAARCSVLSLCIFIAYFNCKFLIDGCRWPQCKR